MPDRGYRLFRLGFDGGALALREGVGADLSRQADDRPPAARSARVPPVLLSDLAPTKQQIRMIAAIAIVLLVAALATLPFRHVQWPTINVFIPIVDAILLFSDLVTATLLYAYFSITQSRALLALATGYFFTGLIIIPHALTFPGAFTETGLLGAGVNTTIWLYYFWHTGLPAAVIAYALLKQRGEAGKMAPAAVPAAIRASILGSIALVGCLTLLATAGHDMLPAMMFDAIHWSSPRLLWIAVPLLALLSAALFLLWRGQWSILDLWLMLMLWAWTIELVLVIFTSSRYSVLWFAGRTYGLLSGLLVLLMLLAETTKLYARLATSVAVRQHERESRLMTMDAVAGSIAHEVNQPLAAIVSNANAGLRWLARDPPDLQRVSTSLDAIANDGHRAADVVTSVRSMFGKTRSDRSPLNVNDIIRDAAKMLSHEIEGQQIVLKLKLGSGLPQIAGDRLQLQQVFLNLYANAIEALSGRPEKRVLSVHSEISDDGDVLVRIKDTGPGLSRDDLERVFDPFFSRKAQGMGLGLSICRSIVDNHGGRLWASTGLPHGSTFHIALPGIRE